MHEFGIYTAAVADCDCHEPPPDPCPPQPCPETLKDYYRNHKVHSRNVLVPIGTAVPGVSANQSRIGVVFTNLNFPGTSVGARIHDSNTDPTTSGKGGILRIFDGLSSYEPSGQCQLAIIQGNICLIHVTGFEAFISITEIIASPDSVSPCK